VYPGGTSGVLRTGNGRDIPFTARDVRILGTTRGLATLREGMNVGFDLGRTSGGLRVTTIRVYDGDGDRDPRT
jgi:cold shock CspA family protein